MEQFAKGAAKYLEYESREQWNGDDQYFEMNRENENLGLLIDSLRKSVKS